MSMKKKVISLVVDTELTNEQIESSKVHVQFDPGDASVDLGLHLARSVRVLDSDEISA